jgi:hypothetical protein
MSVKSHGAAFMDERKSKRATFEQRELSEGSDFQSPTQAKTLNKRLVPVAVLVLEIAEKAAALIDHLEQAAARVVILLVIREMLGQVFDARGEQRDLDLGRARVVGGAAVIRNDLAGLFVRERHLRILKNGETCEKPPGDTWRKAPRACGSSQAPRVGTVVLR